MKKKHFLIYFSLFWTLTLLFSNKEAFSKTYTNTLQKVLETGTLNWGSDAQGGAPYAYFNPENPTELIGFEVDLAREIAKKLGVKSNMIQNEWDALVNALKSKNFDIILSGLEITNSRKNVISFTKPYYIYTQQIVVRKDYNEINKPEDMQGKRVGTLSASAAYKILLKMKDVNIVNYPGVVGPYSDLEKERLDAVLLDLPISVYYAEPNPLLKFTGEPFEKGYYGIGIRQGDTELINRLNQILDDLYQSGKLEKIYRKWGLWNEAQIELSEYKESKVKKIEKRSTWQDLDKNLPLLLKGALVTIKISVISMFFAIILGLTLAVLRLYAPLPLRWLSIIYVEVFRGTPLLIQLYIIYYGLPNLGIKFEPIVAAILGLALNYAAYEAENYRAGIQSVPKGQMEAALALGMTKTMALKKVIIPQAIKIVIPPVSNDFIALFKDSSLVSVITMVELTKQYSLLATANYDFINLGLLTAAIYFVMSFTASMIAKQIEKKLAY